MPDLDQYVIGLMQDSHKSMIRNLRRCEYDEKIAKYKAMQQRNRKQMMEAMRAAQSQPGAASAGAE